VIPRMWARYSVVLGACSRGIARYDFALEKSLAFTRTLVGHPPRKESSELYSEAQAAARRAEQFMGSLRTSLGSN